MRKSFGYVVIILLVPLLTLLIFLSYREWTSAESFHKVLDTKISGDEIKLPQTSFVRAADGAVISEIAGLQKRIYISDKDIPLFLKDLFVTIEDRQFYQHAGIDAVAISRAIVANSQSDSIEQGGSTITQQLARNVYLTQEKTYNRKLTELLYSYQLERTLSKPEILELYINAIYYHNGNYGIESAAQFYFSKSAKNLSKAELAFLAAIPNNPNLYNPLKNYDATKKRQERILSQMVELNKLTKEEYTEIVKEPIVLNVREQNNLYPDYTDYVKSELRSLVAHSEGMMERLRDPEPKIREEAAAELDNKVTDLLESGVTIHTALDTGIQSRAKRAVQSRLSSTNVEGAAVVIQHHTHELVSLIGGTNYKKNSFNRAYQGYRQPGSAIKPLLVYAPYIEETNASLLEGVSGARYCKNGYCPKNYDGSVYGMVTIKKAFANSYNTPALRLFDKTGIRKSFSYLEKFQFSQVNEEDYHLSAAIGGFTNVISPLELTNAFTSFEDGTYLPARAIRKVTGKDGKVLYQWNDKPQTVWKPETVKKMRELLHEVTLNGTATRAYLPGGYIGGKTGTTNDVKDMWFVGLTNDYTTGVWIGKDKPASIEYIQHTYPNLSIWKDINKDFN
ncbi:transglycosylase domain-containing protein [Bacillus sp. V59.32b]|uniref:transglycosylase domain-containing protein n=1 Tax=Bacillus sp. V59.32b TaxID=1758642 RepID=UPI000E3E99CA|nr:transglycosylase domain-containing protein [Bacillus sp. V59.32b]RFU67185.1 penicillin-binding protein [Bacillus sp. V59.32b]